MEIRLKMRLVLSFFSLNFLFTKQEVITMSSADKLLINYEKTIPPNGLDITQVSYDLYFNSLQSVNLNTMQLSVNVIEYTSWVDKRLAYQNNSLIPKYLRDSKIDMTNNKKNIWQPNLGYTELNK